MRHPGSRQMAVLLSTSNHDAVRILRRDGTFVLHHRCTVRPHRRTHARSRPTFRGFRAHNNGIATYQQERNGFSYFYCKRRVLDDGVCTVPLDLEMCPIKKESMDEEEQPMEVDETETPMEVDIPVVLDDNDRYLIHLLETNFENEK